MQRGRNNSIQGERGVKKAKERKQVSTALRVIGPLAWTIHLKLIFQFGPAGHSESISNWSLCQRSGKLAVELIRNIVVLGGSDRETYHAAQQEMGSEPPGQREDESAPYTHANHKHNHAQIQCLCMYPTHPYTDTCSPMFSTVQKGYTVHSHGLIYHHTHTSSHTRAIQVSAHTPTGCLTKYKVCQRTLRQYILT